MALRIIFDNNNNPIMPTMLLANKSGKCYGRIDNMYELTVQDCFNDIPSFSFKVTRQDGKNVCKVWDHLIDLKLVYCVEWDSWFEITVELDDGIDVIKTVSGFGLCQSELSQINLYEVQINTEDDIARDEYEFPTTIYNKDNPDISLLNRILEKAPHYSIGHVDQSLRGIQRTFEFDGKSIKDALDEIATEIGCLVVYDNGNNMEISPHSSPKRAIELYDLKKTCKSCGSRFDIETSCPECGSSDYIDAYGNDTTIFISKDDLTDDIVYSTDIDSVKNNLRMVGGDDLMTATIKHCNPNGGQYIWYVTDEMKADMPGDLVAKLNSYNSAYEYYNKSNVITLNRGRVDLYNTLVRKYRSINSEIPLMEYSITGFSGLMEYVYNCIDFDSYLESVMMETYKSTSTSAFIEASKLNSINLSNVAVSNIQYISTSTADNCVLEMARILVDSRYQVKIKTSSFDKSTLLWSGTFEVTKYSDDSDSSISSQCAVTITDDYAKYVNQKIEKTMSRSDTDDYSITTVMKQELIYNNGVYSGAFAESIRKYSMLMLEVIRDCAQGCIDVLIEQGAGNNANEISARLYEEFYQRYYRKLQAIEKEISLRESELEIIENMQDDILDEIENIHDVLDFESYLGTDLWKVFCSYRRDDVYENPNYISDGLTNAELFKNALEFIAEAEKEIYRSATLQHTISSTLKNLFAIKEFKKLVDSFEVGNWIRIEVDGKIYKLRLLNYSIDFTNFENIEVEFSDVEKYRDGISDLKDVLNQASSMASSYPYVARQSSKGKDAYNLVDGWTTDGMSLTSTKIMNDAYNQDIVWDSHGMLFRKYDSIFGDYEPIQLKIINSTLAITDDSWETTKTAVGRFIFKNPRTNQIETAYGVNAETIVGTVILGEKLGIYNSTGTMSFDLNGFSVRNDKNEVLINPAMDSIFTIKNQDKNVLMFDNEGNGVFTGHIIATSLELKPGVTIGVGNVAGLDDALQTIEDNAVSVIVTEGTDENGHVVKNVAVSKGDDKRQFSVIDTEDFIYTDIAVGDKKYDDAGDAYEAGGSYLKISKDGLIQASNALIYGTIYASDGEFKGVVHANGGSFTNIDGTNINISGNSSFGGTNGITISNGKVVFGSDVDLSFMDGSTYLTADKLKTDKLEATDLSISGSSSLSNITATGLTVYGDSSFSGAVYASSGTFQSGTFTNCTANNLTVNAGSTFKGALDGATGNFTGTIKASSIIIRDKIRITNSDFANNKEKDVLSISPFTVGATDYYATTLKGTSVYVTTTLEKASFSVEDTNGTAMIAGSNVYLSGTTVNMYNSKGDFLFTSGGNVIVSASSMDAQTSYVQATSTASSGTTAVQLRAGSAGHVGIYMPNVGTDGTWLIRRKSDGTIEIPGFSGGSGGGSVDLTGYAKQSWVTSNFASSSHTHSTYAPKASPTISGEIYLNCSVKKSAMSSGSGRTAIWKNGNNTPDQSDSWLSFSTGSSKRYKNIHDKVQFSEIEKLFTDVSLYWFTYKDEYLGSDDERYHKDVIGFIAEDIDEVLPIAVNHLDNGLVDMWNSDIIVPIVFAGAKQALIESRALKVENIQLKSRLDQQQYMIEQLFNEITKIKQEM